MQKVNVHAFYRFGISIREATLLPMIKLPVLVTQILPDLEEKITFTPERVLETISIQCGAFLRETTECHLPESRKIAEQMHQLGIEHSRSLFDAQGDQRLREGIFRQLLFQLQALSFEFENALSHETNTINAFVTGDKLDKNIDVLAMRAHECYSADVIKHLPDQTVYDFKEAGKCLLFDCYTAMGYHIFRGVEGLMTKYYEVVAGKPYTGDRGWGQVEQALTAKRLNVPVRLLNSLANMRVYWRNEIAHPGFNIEPDEAMPLYNIAQVVVPMMTKEIDRLTP